MKIKQYIYLTAILLTAASCKAPSNLTYFQNAEEIRGMALQAEKQIRLRPEDKVNIVVNSTDPMLSSQFTLIAPSARYILGSEYVPLTTAGNNASSTSAVIAYTVDEQGDINFPVLGKLSVAGKTRTELADFIAKRLIERDLIKDPIVTVEFLNMGVNVLGEVRSPGRINITRDHMTIMDAIAYAGDLTIDGKRENVMVSRQVDGEDQTYIIDLTNKQQVMLSPAYYLQQNDVVYVSPTSKRKRESTSAGNTMQSPSFWIALGSLLTTVSALLLK